MHALKYAFLSLVLLSSTIGYSQRSETDSVAIYVHKMAAHNIYELSTSVGFAGILSTQYQNFERIVSLASEEQLKQFATYHLNPVARLYCYQALKRRNSNIPENLAKQMKKDNTHVTTIMGCIVNKTTVNALLERDVFYSY